MLYQEPNPDCEICATSSGTQFPNAGILNNFTYCRRDCGEGKHHNADFECVDNPEGCNLHLDTLDDWSSRKIVEGYCTEAKEGYFLVQEENNTIQNCQAYVKKCKACTRNPYQLGPICTLCPGESVYRMFDKECFISQEFCSEKHKVPASEGKEEVMKKYWVDVDDNCVEYKDQENCLLAEDITGKCIEAKVGMFVDLEGEVKACSTVDPNCRQCLNETGICFTCVTDYILNPTTKICEKPIPLPLPVPDPKPIGEYTEGEQKINRSFSVSKNIVEGVSVAVMLVGAPAGVILAQTVQTLDFLGFINVDKSTSLRGSTEQFKIEILNFVPNPFIFDGYEEA